MAQKNVGQIFTETFFILLRLGGYFMEWSTRLDFTNVLMSTTA